MRVLFVHQNFPGQFKFLAPALAKQGHTVVALRMQPLAQPEWQGVRLVGYRPARGSTPGLHPWVGDIETKTIRAEAAFHAALKLKAAGFEPDVIIAHPGWGESLFLKHVWPRARLGIYCEFFYHAAGADIGFDPEFGPVDPAEACRVQMKNLNYSLHFDLADLGISPTHWQASTFPEKFRHAITVVHDGIDTDRVAPDPAAEFSFIGAATGVRQRLTRADEVITFVNRNLEPYRGYHVFMRALPDMLEARPNAQVLIVGGDDVSYGARPPSGQSWKQLFLNEVQSKHPGTDWSRVHFLGKLPYGDFLRLLQVSSVHVYLTYPFVLSWSLLEAMSAGCAIVASRTAPVLEAIESGKTGELVDFFDAQGLAARVSALLADPARRGAMGKAARQFAKRHYDLKTVCLPRQLDWVAQLHGLRG